MPGYRSAAAKLLESSQELPAARRRVSPVPPQRVFRQLAPGGKLLQSRPHDPPNRITTSARVPVRTPSAHLHPRGKSRVRARAPLDAATIPLSVIGERV